MEKPKNCPFCGREVRRISGVVKGLIMFVCDGCNATVSFGGKEFDIEKATAAFNRRQTEETA